jgi:SSS family solute:Na+ symporter
MSDPTLTWSLGISLVAYVVLMFGLGAWAQGRIRTNEDFIVAGRRLPLSLAWATLLATWFGAGTVLTQANEVKDQGLQRAALDPFGAGTCLILAGLFFAAPLWRMGLLTLPDFFRRKFGPSAEVFASLIMVPSYFGWVAAQFVALGEVLHVFFPGLSVPAWILVVAGVGTGYTLMGGMWSVTITDAVQIVLVLVGLVILLWATLSALGGGVPLVGLERLYSGTRPDFLRPVPTETWAAVWGWVGVFCVGALGNLPGQDLTQRIFAARSPGVARNACLVAGALYLLFGFIPLLLGLAGRMLLPGENGSIVPALAVRVLTSVPVFVVFMLALVSAVLSTIDSAILSPASVLSQNLLEKVNGGAFSSLSLNRTAVVLVAGASLALAFVGRDAYELLEGAYELTFVGLFVPLVLGMYLTPRGQLPALLSMAVGTGVWGLHYLAMQFDDGWEKLFGVADFPIPLTCALLGLVVYLAVHHRLPAREGEGGS